MLIIILEFDIDLAGQDRGAIECPFIHALSSTPRQACLRQLIISPKLICSMTIVFTAEVFIAIERSHAPALGIVPRPRIELWVSIASSCFHGRRR